MLVTFLHVLYINIYVCVCERTDNNIELIITLNHSWAALLRNVAALPLHALNVASATPTRL